MNPEMGPTQSELTGEAQNAYSGSMPDPTNSNTESSPQTQADTVATEQIEAQIIERMREQGLQVDAASRETIKQMAKLMKAGVVQMPGEEKPVTEEARIQEHEAKSREKYFVATSSALLSPYVENVNKFLIDITANPKSYDKDIHDAVTSAIRYLDPTEGMSEEAKRDFEIHKRRDFDMSKAMLLGDISDKTARFSGAHDKEEVRIYKENIATLIGFMRSGDYSAIEAFFNDDVKSDMERSTYSEALSTAIANLEAEIAEHPEDKELVAKYERTMEFAMEYAMERIISIGDNAPTQEYPRFNLYQSDNLDRITQMARVYDERRIKAHGKEYEGEKMFNYLVSLKGLRQAMHELFRGMKDEKTYLGFITGLLRKGGLAFVEKDVAGVSDVQMVYEQLLGSALSLNKGWLTDQDMEKVDKEARGVLEHYKGLDFFQKGIKDASGNKTGRQMRDWEIQRAALMGRSLSAASQRRLVYAVLGDVPKDGPISYKSLESEFIARRLALIKLIPERFFDQPESVRQLELLEEELMRNPDTDKLNYRKYGYVTEGRGSEKDRAKGLYGNEQRAFAFLDTGVADPKSNGWRQNLLFLRQRGYEIRVGDRKVHLGEFLEEAFSKAKKLSEEQAPGDKQKRKQEKIREHLFNDNEAVHEAIANQRLFLGVLMRNSNLNSEHKQLIWKHVAEFLPSRIAAFFPEETLKIVGGEARWMQIRNKLFMAETARVKNDAAHAKALNNDKIRPEDKGNYKDLREFYQMAGLSADEIATVEQIIGFGKSHAKDLAKITFPFVAFLDDVPETGWDELADEDYDRILINDQTAFSEGYGNIVGLIAHTVKKPEDVVEAFHAAIEKTESPLGIDTAQKKMEPFVAAVLRMRRATNTAKWLGMVMKMARMPRSEIEKFNLQARIAEDEEEQRDMLINLAQLDVISDDPSEKDKKGRTMYVRMLDKEKANRKHQLYRVARIFILLFGAEFAKAFLGSGIMDDIEGFG